MHRRRARASATRSRRRPTPPRRSRTSASGSSARTGCATLPGRGRARSASSCSEAPRDSGGASTARSPGSPAARRVSAPGVARRLAGFGAKVVVSDINAQSGEAVAADIGGSVRAVRREPARRVHRSGRRRTQGARAGRHRVPQRRDLHRLPARRGLRPCAVPPRDGRQPRWRRLRRSRGLRPDEGGRRR